MIFNSLTDLAMTERLHQRPHEAVTGTHANTQRQVHYTISPLTYVQKNKKTKRLTLPQRVNSVHLKVPFSAGETFRHPSDFSSDCRLP